MIGRDCTLTERLGAELRGEWVGHDLSGDGLDFEWFNGHARAGMYSQYGRWRLAGGATVGLIREDFRLTRNF